MVSKGGGETYVLDYRGSRGPLARCLYDPLCLSSARLRPVYP
jgi:hypothetical protein